MFITELKPREAIKAAIAGNRIFLLICHGCKEIFFPEKKVNELCDAMTARGIVTGKLVTDYVCNPENLALRLKDHREELEAAGVILVFGCGVGVQTVAGMFPDKRVCAACDTYALPGFQGVTPLEEDCDLCGKCYLNLTGGVCPITSCAKGLINGPCGGAKNGKCEVDPDMECGWERIFRRLKAIGRMDVLQGPVQLRDYAAGTEGNKESNL